MCPAPWFKPSPKPEALMSHLMKRWLANYCVMLWLIAQRQGIGEEKWDNLIQKAGSYEQAKLRLGIHK